MAVMSATSRPLSLQRVCFVPLPHTTHWQKRDETYFNQCPVLPVRINRCS